MDKKYLLNSFKIFMCCVGTVIGAGFASGQEIMSYFVRYGEKGALGICICGLMFFLYVYAVLKKIYINNITDFKGFFSDIAGDSAVKLMEYISYSFMFASFVVMVSGSGAVADELFNGKTAGILFMAILCYVVFLKGVDGFIVINSVMTPLIILGISAVGVLTLCKGKEVFLSMSDLSDNFFVSSLLYVSYNTITLIGVLLPLKNKITSKKVVLYSSFFSGGLLLLMGLVLWAVMNAYKAELINIQVPMLYIAQTGGEVLKYLYAAVLYMSMITTAVSSGFAFLSFLKEKTGIKSAPLSVAICVLSIPLSYIGFADLVGKLYKFFGFLGVFVMVVVFADGIGQFFKEI